MVEQLEHTSCDPSSSLHSFLALWGLSVLGLGALCSFWLKKRVRALFSSLERFTYYKPQALHSNSSSADRLHRGVDVAPQFVHVGLFSE